MKNILHIIESLEFGGAEKVVLHLANGLSDKYNISICVTKREGELLKELKDNISIFSLKSDDGNNLSTIRKIAKIIKDNKINVVHIHNWGVFIESTLASKLCGVDRIIHTVHGPYISYSNEFISNLKKFIRHSIERLISKYIYKFITVSKSIKDYMVDDIGINKNKIITIHNGIAGLNKSAHCSSSKKILNLISIGRVAKIKNHYLLLDALNKINNSIDYNLTVVGDGPELNNIKKYCDKLKLNDKVNFLGFRNDIENILVDMDLCIVTSDYEGISIAILESMSVGIPVIATSVGGNPETVINEETGLLIEKGNVDALADAILKLSNNRSLLDTMGIASYQRFKNYFHESIVFNAYSLIYDE